jgi:hypothetical protein
MNGGLPRQYHSAASIPTHAHLGLMEWVLLETSKKAGFSGTKTTSAQGEV